MAVKNPKKLSWTGASEYDDNTPYPDAERKGYDVGFRVKSTTPGPYVALLSVVAQADLQTAFISDLDSTQLKNKVVYELAVRDVTATGMVSDWSLPVEVEFDRKPNPPSLTVS